MDRETNRNLTILLALVIEAGLILLVIWLFTLIF